MSKYAGCYYDDEGVTRRMGTHEVVERSTNINLGDSNMARLEDMKVNITLHQTTAMKDFIEASILTESLDIPAITSRLSTQRDLRLLHAVLGLATETGELVDVVKKHVYYGKDKDTVNIKEEVGDLLWYIAILLHEYGWSFEEVTGVVLAKLRTRYPLCFTEHDALNRDLQKERVVLEGGAYPDLLDRIAASLGENETVKDVLERQKGLSSQVE